MKCRKDAVVIMNDRSKDDICLECYDSDLNEYGCAYESSVDCFECIHSFHGKDNPRDTQGEEPW